ncbi:MAG TPA: CGNR zinc finger domain-containing protein [Candidatus Rubrimentiphilum sp.]|nr:CGNR zinc finger domain-containing protein [Candidatus Rubrimentiphilum sp.]
MNRPGLTVRKGQPLHHGKYLIALERDVINLAASLLSARESLDGPAAAAWWASAQRASLDLIPLAAGCKPRFNAALAAELQSLSLAAERLVDAIRGGAPVPADALETLNNVLARAHPTLVADRSRLGLAVTDGTDVVLVPAAYAIATLTQSDLRRLKRCRLSGCSTYFWDTTKNRSRRWCSLRCMERERAPRRRQDR